MMCWNHHRHFGLWQVGLMRLTMIEFVGLALWAVDVSARRARQVGNRPNVISNQGSGCQLYPNGV